MSISPQSINAMLLKIQIKDKYDFLKPLIHFQIIRVSVKRPAFNLFHHNSFGLFVATFVLTVFFFLDFLKTGRGRRSIASLGKQQRLASYVTDVHAR